jgi:inosine-uridine nucleoside N-ribohydrolase
MKRLLAGLAAVVLAGAAPIPVIFDTDIGNDIDDALALACLHGLESLGEVKLLAVTITKDNRHAAPFVDLVNHFYKRPGIPVGIVRGGKTPKDSPYLTVPVERRDAAGKPVYRRAIEDSRQAAEAVGLLRRTLEGQRDRSIAIVQVGFSTNLARLLESPGGKELVARKVKLLSIMAGEFPTGKPEYNVRVDIAAFRRIVEEWPTPAVFSGFEIGKTILYPARTIENDFGYVPFHPVADAYRQYMKMPYDRPTWDLTSVLYAARPEGGYFSLSAAGTVRVDDEGTTSHTASAGGKHRYLTVNDEQRGKVLKALIELSSRAPDSKR